MRLERRLAGWLLVCVALVAPVRAADWQFAVDVPDGNKQAKAYLWIPPQAPYVRGILVGQQVILEDKVLQDPAIRDVCAKENLAIVLICPGVVGYFDTTKGADAQFQSILDSLAKESGYGEIAQAPLISLGHSGMGIFAWRIAYHEPERMIGVIGLHCMSSHPAEAEPKSSVEGVPILDISGEYESWGNPRLPLDTHWRWLRGGLLEYRAQYERALMSEVVDPGGTHFSFNPPLARYVALFIQKACEYRLPPMSASPPTGSVTLRDIPVESGWLTDITMLTPSHYPPASYADYTGDRSLAFWHFDREMAEATEHFREDAHGKLDQRVTFTQDGQPLPAKWIEDLKFEPLPDGVSFKVSADFLKQTPEGVAGAGRPLGHADGPVQFSLIGGWRGGGEQTGPDTFRIKPGHLGPTDNIMFLAYHPGDARYAWAEQAAEVKYPRENKAGTPQTITFPTIADQPAGTKSVKLGATASSGLPIDYYVVRGPAQVDGDQLVFTPIPQRVTGPIKVTVVATQWGRSISPQVQTAPSAEQTFQLQR
jgi:hypothetical protein